MLAFARGGVDACVINIAAPIAETVRLTSDMMPCDVQLELKPGEVLPAVSIDADDIGQICLQLCVRGREPRGDSGIVRLELAAVNVPDFVCSACGDRYERGESVRLTVTDSFSRPPSGPAKGALGTPCM